MRKRQTKKAQKISRARSLDDLEGRVIAGKILNGFYGVSEQDTWEYLHFVRKEPDHKLAKILRLVLYSFDSGYSRALDNLESTISEYEQWFGDARRHPIVRKVLDARLDSDTIMNALQAAGAKPRAAMLAKGEEPSIYDLSGWYELEREVLDIAHKVDRYDSNQKLNHLRTLSAKIRAIFVEEGIEVTQKYVEDLVEEIRGANLFSLPSTGPIDFLPGLLIREGVEAVPVIERVDGFRDYYIKLGREGIKILNLFPKENGDRLELAKIVADGLGNIRAAEVDLREVHKLVNGVNAAQRLELFDYLCDNAQSMVTYQRLRRVGIRDDEYANFLISQSHLTVNTANGPATLLETITEIAKSPSQIKAAASLLRHATNFVFSPDSQEIAQIASSYALADLIIEDYFAAIRDGQHNKATLSLLLGKYQPDTGSLRNIRQQLRATNDNEFGWATEITSFKDLERKLRGLQIREKVEATKADVQRQVEWYELMVSSLRAQNVSDSALALIGDAYQKLTNSLAYRLRNIWKTQPDSLEEFCGDVIGLYEVEAFQMILKSPALFSAYKRRLGSKEPVFGTQLRNISSTQGANLYRAIHRFLIPESPNTPLEVEEVPNAEKIERIKFKNATRVIVWGGQYSSDAKERIQRAVPDKPVDVYDIFNKKTDVEGLGPTDVIIWVTTSNSHPSYYAIKRHSKLNGIGFYHFGRSGTNTLVEFLQTMSA